jgi:hypothetical protein
MKLTAQAGGRMANAHIDRIHQSFALAAANSEISKRSLIFSPVA